MYNHGIETSNFYTRAFCQLLEKSLMEPNQKYVVTFLVAKYMVFESMTLLFVGKAFTVANRRTLSYCNTSPPKKRKQEIDNLVAM